MGIICSFCQKLHQPDIGVTYFDSRRERRVVLKFNEETGADFNAGNCNNRAVKHQAITTD